MEGGSGGGGGGSSGGSSALAARHPKQKRKAHSLSIRRTNSTEERPLPGMLRGDMLEGQVSLGTRSNSLCFFVLFFFWSHISSLR